MDVHVKLILMMVLMTNAWTQRVGRRIGKMEEVFAWKQITYVIDGEDVLHDRLADDDLGRYQQGRQHDKIYFGDDDEGARRNWKPWLKPAPSQQTPRPTESSPTDDTTSFFIQYNNLPMGAERVGDRLFITVPRRRYGIPSTLNYIHLPTARSLSPPLRPYPTSKQTSTEDRLVSVYRTRADSCGRLWMVDTGLLEIPNNPQQVQPPAIVVFDLATNQQILRYPFKSSDLPAANTPTGLASITVDLTGDCGDAFAYVPDLTTYGLIVFSLRERDSWRIEHNYFHFDPVAGNLNVAGLSFQWSDGIFSVTLSEPDEGGCRTAYFHPMVSTQQFSVSTCALKNRTAIGDADYWKSFRHIGDRGVGGQSTMHGYHAGARVLFHADIVRGGISCWRARDLLSPSHVAILATHNTRMMYPSDLHVTGDEVWMMTNSLPRYGYSRLDPNEYNFHVYRGNVSELISGTVCESPKKNVWS